MSRRIADMRVALEGLIRRDAQRWAGDDPFISKKDAARDASGYRPEIVQAAAAEVRAAEGPGARVTVGETTAHLLAQAEEVWSRFNGGDTDVLSAAELAELKRELPSFYELTRRAIEQAERSAQLGHPERVETLADFRALPLETQELLLDDYGAEPYANLSATPDVFLDELRGRKKRFAERLLEFMENEVGDPPEDFGHIGEPKVRFRILTLPSGEIAGGRVWMKQQGFDPDELGAVDPPWHFDTPDEARAAGYDPAQDISWSAGGRFDADGESLSHDTYWEWTGW